MAKNYTTLIQDNEFHKLLYEKFTSPITPEYILVGEEKVCMPKSYINIIEEIDNFEIRDDDIFIASYPKTGTTWTQEMVWMIMNNADKEKAKEVLNKRSPFFEMKGIFDYSKIIEIKPDFEIIDFMDSIKYTENMESPRIIKTHLHWQMLPKQIRERTKNPKIIYVTRNPKDTCVSFYHHCRNIQGFNIDNLDDFTTLFMKGYMAYGSYFDQVLSFVKQCNNPNILHITYEEMSKDLTSVICRVSKFLNKPINKNDPILPIILEHLSFESMKNNLAVNKRLHVELFKNILQKDNQDVNFMRKGKVGSYKEEMSEKTIKRIEEWINENYRKVDGLKEFIEIF